MKVLFECEVSLEVSGVEDKYANIPVTIDTSDSLPPVPDVVMVALERLWVEGVTKNTECELTVKIRTVHRDCE